MRNNPLAKLRETIRRLRELDPDELERVSGGGAMGPPVDNGGVWDDSNSDQTFLPFGVIPSNEGTLPANPLDTSLDVPEADFGTDNGWGSADSGDVDV